MAEDRCMRVVVNQLPALGVKTGIGHYTVQLMRCLRAQTAPDESIEAFPSGWVRKFRRTCTDIRPWLEGNGEGQSDSAPEAPVRASVRNLVVQQLRQFGRSLMAKHFRLVTRRQRYDLYHEPNFIPLPTDCPTLVTLHDLSVLHHPEWHPADRVAHFERHFVRGLDRCDHFLAISDFGRQEVIDTLGIAPERVTRTYMGIRPGLGPLPPGQVQEVLRELALPPKYLLYLGTIEPRKNLLTLLQAYSALPAVIRARWPLLMVGNWGWNSADVAAYLQNEARHRGVIHLGYVKERHLPAIYNGARALVYPSLYEGFGLPPIEMMACGGAVLASTVGALQETVGSKAHLIGPSDRDGWRDAMLRVLTDDDWCRELRRGTMAVAQRFTWDRCAADTLRVYRRMTGRAEEKAPPLRAAG
jgi:glycosyltransferase involved in cell wall biosynthesis